MQRYRMPALLGGLAALAVTVALLGVAFWSTPAGVAQEQQPLIEYPDYPPTPTIGLNPTAEPALASQELFRSNFDSAEALAQLTAIDLATILADWRGNWVVQDSRLMQDHAGRARNSATHEVAALVNGVTFADGTVRVNFYDQFNGIAGIMTHYNGDVAAEATYYRYRIIKNEYESEPKQVLEKVVDGVATSLVEIKQAGFTPREWHTLQMTVIDGLITVTLDGTVVIEASDPQPLPAGQAGVYTRAIGGIFYDDLTITTP